MERGRRQPPRRRNSREQPQRKNHEDYDYEDYDYDEYEIDDQEEVRRPRPQPSRQRQRQRPVKKQRVWPLLFMGCGLGVLVTVLGAALVVFLAVRTSQGGTIPTLPIISNAKAFTKDEKQALTNLAPLTQLQVCDKVGNVSIKVDQTVGEPSITAHKTVQATSQAAADQAFETMAVQVTPQTISGLSCLQSPATAQTSANSLLTVNVSFPDSKGLARANSNTVDLSIVLPPAMVQSNGPQLALDVEAPIGNITVDGLSGVLNIRGGTGNVSVSHAALADNSHIDTGQGNVTFNGLLILPNGANATAHYFIRSEQGGLDVTLPTGTNATLDANTNVGTINTDFPITIKANSDGSASYHGPLTPSGSASSSVVVVDVSTGNINIHQLQA